MLSTRAATTLTAVGLAGGALVSLGAAPASASTIQNGWLQICAQGNYSAQIDIAPPESGSGQGALVLSSIVVAPGMCWWHSEDTDDQWVPMTVIGY